jgi:predicted DNA-binding protein YlxM (UPF0122 family)
MTWTKEDAGKLMEYYTARMTVAEIAAKMDKPEQWIRDELKSRGCKPIEKHPEAESDFLKGFKPVEIKRKPYAKITTSVEKRVCKLRESCHTTTQIAEKLNIAQQTVSNILKRNGYSTKRGEYHKLSLEDITETKEDKPVKVNEDFDKAVDQMIAEAKEKEPVPSANDTSSEQDITPVIPTTNDTTSIKKSQPLTGVRMLGELENLLRELFTEQVEITSLSGELDVASIKFRLDGEGYWISFGPQQEPPVYGKEVVK